MIKLQWCRTKKYVSVPWSQVQVLVRNADAGDMCLTGDWALHWFNKATKVQQALMSVTRFYIPTMSVVLNLPGNLFRYKCIQPITMSSICQKARKIPTFYEPAVHDCWCFTCCEQEKGRERGDRERDCKKEVGERRGAEKEWEREKEWE